MTTTVTATTSVTASTETLSVKTWRASQSLEAERIDRLPDGTRIRAHVRRNAYDAQSYAVVEAWTIEAGWRPITSTPIERTRLHGHSYTERGGWEAHAQADLLELIEEGAAFFG